jgi:hypothetical protein
MVFYQAVPFRCAIPMTFLALAAILACGPGTFDHFKYSVKIGAKDEVGYQGDATKEVVDGFENLGRELAPAVGRHSFKLKLIRADGDSDDFGFRSYRVWKTILIDKK